MCVTGSNTMQNSAGSWIDSSAFSPGGSSITSMVKSSKRCLEIVRQVDARAPEMLAGIFDVGQRIRIVPRDPAHARAYGEHDLDHLVQRRLVAASTQRAVVFIVVDRLQRRAGFQHAAAAGAQHVPGHVEDAEPRRMQERGDGVLLVEVIGFGEVEHIEPAQGAVAALRDQPFDRLRRLRGRRSAAGRRTGPRFRS